MEVFEHFANYSCMYCTVPDIVLHPLQSSVSVARSIKANGLSNPIEP